MKKILTILLLTNFVCLELFSHDINGISITNAFLRAACETSAQFNFPFLCPQLNATDQLVEVKYEKNPLSMSYDTQGKLSISVSNGQEETLLQLIPVPKEPFTGNISLPISLTYVSEIGIVLMKKMASFLGFRSLKLSNASVKGAEILKRNGFREITKGQWTIQL